MKAEEIEVKFYLADQPALEQRLRSSKAKLDQARVHEVNLRFDTADGSLARLQQVLRLRQDTRARLTFKGPGQKRQDVLQRVELEFTVSDFDMAKAFLEALGYQVSVIYEKYRTSYSMDSVEITLDEMPYGNFVEIEGPDSDSIQAVARKLGLKWDARILDNYLILFERLRTNLGFTFRDLTFENFKPLQVLPQDLNLQYAD